MRPVNRSRVVAALVVLVVWLVSLAGEPRPALGAPTESTLPVLDPPCCDRQEEQRLIDERREERQQERMERNRRLREQQEERQAKAELLATKRIVRQEAALRKMASRSIQDLVPAVYQDLVIAVAERFALEPRLLAAVGSVESHWYAKALGTHGDSGLMQIIPSTAEWIASRMGMQEYDIYDPLTNLTMGAWYLHVLCLEYGDLSQALAAYNGGPRAAPQGAEHRYTKLVMRVYQKGA